MEIESTAIGVLVACYVAAPFISGFFLWVAMKFMGLDGSFWALVLASAISSLCGLIPFVGFIVGAVVLFWLLYKWTSMDHWLYGVILVVIARVLMVVTALGLMRLFA